MCLENTAVEDVSVLFICVTQTIFHVNVPAYVTLEKWHMLNSDSFSLTTWKRLSAV